MAQAKGESEEPLFADGSGAHKLRDEAESVVPGRSHTPRTIGDHELIREIGRGGMGVVYEARQRNLKRIVALKLILTGEFASETAVARFREEAELVGSLQHPHIVPIYEVDEDNGRHFYTMKLIEGPTLAAVIAAWHEENANLAPPRSAPRLHPAAKKRLDMRRAVQLLATVARAVHFAHQRGIIHRDLSPENILVDQDGHPWVTDFGMARWVNADRRLTVTQAIVGKPDYMSPEQADPRTGHLTTASDIFSLGAILYHVLTGQRPFAAETPLATIERIRDHNPPLPSTLNHAIDRDLETIILKCLAKSPDERYASAAALVDDLERWLRREPILARPIGAVEASWKWINRNPLKSAFAVAASGAILGPLITTFYLYFFVLPQQARAHPIVGRDQNIRGFVIPLDTGRVDRATLNFDTYVFTKRSRPARLYFTNIPPENMAWVSNLQCQVFADIPGAPDIPRGPKARHGDTFTISQARRRDRAYYICPFGWQGEEILARAPDARLCIELLDPETD